MIKRMLLLAILLLLVGGIGSFYTAKSVKEQAETVEESVIVENSFNSIYLAADNAKITLIPTTDEQAKVEMAGNQTGSMLTTEVINNTLDVNLKHKRSKLFSFDLFSSALSLTVYVPEKSYDTIQVKSKNGAIEIADLAGNDLKVDTNNGGITFSNLATKFIKAETDNGKIELKNVTGEITAKTSNGGINLVTNDLDRSIDLGTDNGKIAIHSKEKPTNAILDIKVGNGKVRVFGVKDWDTKIGNGENTIKLKSSNGNITLSH